MCKPLKLFLLCLCALVGLAGALGASAYEHNEKWIKSLDDGTLITGLSIPGTHDSAATYDNCHKNSKCRAVIEFAHTQTYSIQDQIKLGIRYLDIRLAYENDDLRFHHGPYYLETNFNTVLGQARDFLKENPSEFLIFMIKQEHTDHSGDYFWSKVNNAFKKFPDSLFWLDKKVPTVGEARGKIIIMGRQKSSHPQGYLVNWTSDTLYYKDSDGSGDNKLAYVVEDHYSLNTVSTKAKFRDIRQNLTLARMCTDCGDKNSLFITFLSGEGDATGRTPSHFASYENPEVSDWLNGASYGARSGVVVMDFAGDSDHGGQMLVDQVIGQNYSRRIPGEIASYNQGAGLAIADLNHNGSLDLITLMINGPSRSHLGSYKIGWDMDGNGTPARWGDLTNIPQSAENAQGGGLATADVNQDGNPDLIVYWIENPSGANNGAYMVGYTNSSGTVTEWGPRQVIDGPFGSTSRFGGIAAGDIDGNGFQDLVITMVNASGEAKLYYQIGWDMDTTGVPARWDDAVSIPDQISDPQGGGLALADLNGDGIKDLVVYEIDSSPGPNCSHFNVGYMTKSGAVSHWWGTNYLEGWMGDTNAGGGAAVADLDGDGHQDLTVFFIYAPSGENTGYFQTYWDWLNQ